VSEQGKTQAKKLKVKRKGLQSKSDVMSISYLFLTFSKIDINVDSLF